MLKFWLFEGIREMLKEEKLLSRRRGDLTHMWTHLLPPSLRAKIKRRQEREAMTVHPVPLNPNRSEAEVGDQWVTELTARPQNAREYKKFDEEERPFYLD